jgi:hypothetical protein
VVALTPMKAPMKALGYGAASVGACVMAGLVHACTIVNGLVVPDVDGGGDAEVDPCAHARIPPRPASSLDPHGGTILAALRSVDFGGGDGGVNEVGYDLDNACTCFERANSEGTCIATGPECDIDPAHGRDNNAAVFVRSIALREDGDVQAHINANIANGGGTLFIKVDDVGGRIDSSVLVSLIPSSGTHWLDDGGTAPDGAPPAFDKTDHWWIDSTGGTSLPDGGFFSSTQGQGYIADGVLVAGPFMPFKMRLPGEFELVVSEGYLIADIDVTGDAPKIRKGTFTGRWPVEEVFRMIGRMDNPLTNEPFCADLAGFTALANKTLCLGADLTASHLDDGKGKQCDAISTAIAFEAYEPGDFAGTHPATTFGDPCAGASIRCPPSD